MKTIPFSIEYYNSHPGCQVVDRLGRKQRVLATDLETMSGKPVCATYDSQEYASKFTVGGYYYALKSESDYDLFILVTPTYRPYKDASEVPLNCWVRGKGEMNKQLIVSLDTNYVRIWDGTVSLQNLFIGYEQSIDCVTWGVCGVEE